MSTTTDKPPTLEGIRRRYYLTTLAYKNSVPSQAMVDIDFLLRGAERCQREHDDSFTTIELRERLHEARAEVERLKAELAALKHATWQS